MTSGTAASDATRKEGGDPAGALEPHVSESLAVRPPLQERSRQAWIRILDAGVEVLEVGGYEAFTIAEVCRRARVAPPTLYARVDTKDDLFLAVYEHGMARVRSDQAAFEDEERWGALSPRDATASAVRLVAHVFLRHEALLRSVVLVSGGHPEVYRRGGAYSRDLGRAFADRVLAHRDAIDHPDPGTAVPAAFNTVFSTLVLRVAYGQGFAVPGAADEFLVEELVAMTLRYLFP